MVTMYELTSDYMSVLAMAQDPDIPPEAIVDTLEGMSGEIEIKAESCAIVIQELKADTVKLKAEIDRLTARKKALEDNIERIKNSVYNAMKLVEKPKFKTALFSFSIQKNPVKLIIDDFGKIPKKYFTPQPAKLDAVKLRDDLKAGALRKYAHLEQGESLRIK